MGQREDLGRNDLVGLSIREVSLLTIPFTGGRVPGPLDQINPL